jgi:hypothetical protein
MLTRPVRPRRAVSRWVGLGLVGILAGSSCSAGNDTDVVETTSVAPPSVAPPASTVVPVTTAPTTTSVLEAPVDECAGVASPREGPADDLAGNADRALLLRCVRMNQIQVIGTHNSYKQPVPAPIFALLSDFDPVLASELEYWHPPLSTQLGDEAVRQIELDVFADPEGGRYAARVGLQVAGVPNDAPPELNEPGFKVLHVQDLDYETSCLTFVDCLGEVAAWSDQHPGHLPIAVLVELKDSPIPDPIDAGFVVPLPIGPTELDALDDEIRSVFTADRLIVPDDVRRSFSTLEAAVLADGWPTLAEATGKVIFLMDNGGALRDLYRTGRPSLEGRVMFTSAEPGSPDAAFVKVNDPLDAVGEIQALVAAGYVVRTRADVPTEQARTADTTQRDAALASGAQWVSTDYPVPGRSPFSEYSASLPGGTVARCNPVNTGPRCVDELLEVLTG